MSTKPIADVCIIGVGLAGGILAKQLGSAGLNVVAFERGPLLRRSDYEARDAIRFIVRSDALEWERHEPVAFRRSASERASIRPATTNAVGGQSLVWTGTSARFAPDDFKLYSRDVASGVADRAKADLRGYEIYDWPIDYDALEPFYEQYEWEFGIAGGGPPSPFAGRRRRDFPVPPLRKSAKMELFESACRKLGYKTYLGAAGMLSKSYAPPAEYDSRIEKREACTYCGHCNAYMCHVNAKSSTLYITVPVALKTGNVELRTHTKIFRIETDAAGNASGVSYFTPEGNKETQPAKVVILCGYTFENARLLLLSSNNKGQALANAHGNVGKGLMAHRDIRVSGRFDDYIVNNFIGPNAASVQTDDFYGNNFDHTGLGFISGAFIFSSGEGTPVQRYNVVPPGSPTWGAAYKESLAKYYRRNFEINVIPETLAHQDNLVDLDPDHVDKWGVPIPRVTFSPHQNEERQRAYFQPLGEKIMQAAGANQIWTQPGGGGSRWAGGTRMGDDPATSVVNGYGQAHEAPNLFVIGASMFPTVTGFPHTATIAAIAYRTAKYIIGQKQWFG